MANSGRMHEGTGPASRAPLAASTRTSSEARTISGDGEYVFPLLRDPARPLHGAALGGALGSLGFDSTEVTPHGFRATACTLLNELGWRSEAIERQLAHSERNKVRAAYNKAQRLPERRKMMQAWADYLDGLRAGKQVAPSVVDAAPTSTP